MPICLTGSETLQGRQSFRDFNGGAEIVFEIVHALGLTEKTGYHFTFQIVYSLVQAGQTTVDLFVKTLDLDLDAGQAFPDVADPGGDGLLQDFLDDFYRSGHVFSLDEIQTAVLYPYNNTEGTGLNPVPFPDVTDGNVLNCVQKVLEIEKYHGKKGLCRPKQ